LPRELGGGIQPLFLNHKIGEKENTLHQAGFTENGTRLSLDKLDLAPLGQKGTIWSNTRLSTAIT
jgi:hypothetical protein